MTTNTENTQQQEPVLERPGSRNIDSGYVPSPEAQARIDALKKDPDYYAVGTAKQRKLATEMHDLLTGAPGVVREGETQNQAAIRALNASGKLTSADPAVRAEALRELRQRLAAESTEAEREAILTAPVEVLRERFGVDEARERIVPSLTEKWDAASEQQALSAFAELGTPPEHVTAAYEFYINVYNQNLGDISKVGDTAAMEADFRAAMKKAGMDPRLVDRLVAWEKERLS
jgi:hypothetical protein